ncbi:CoA transferase [Sphingobium sp. BYY-5]|uniref:CoA transferase n=1 Tax=Sphingobium sp. BYY-5 TaxID=2926400 RepID=UPI001FA78D9B|nr:CoA transferase [Sphingobium sp. BYY-5]MCI4592039.1 CoA transferase [Sphingobium sp. BYY-5]
MAGPRALPLSHWAEAELRSIERLGGGTALSSLTATQLMGERAALNGFRIPGRISAGGGCRLYDTLDMPVALTLARPDDRAMLPALFGESGIDGGDDAQLIAAFAARRSEEMVAQGRLLGLAIARIGETPVSPVCAITAEGEIKARTAPPLVIDLSALWAGPLAAHLVGLCGARVIKVESHTRPDRMREGDPALFARLNQGKANIALDLRHGVDRAALIALISRADLVIESARPRALRQLGIDADALVRAVPGLVWMTITGHGTSGEAAHWIGFGDDCSVTGGLSSALLDAGGSVGFGGDACADPLIGIRAAHLALARLRDGRGARMILSMSAIIAHALASETRRDEDALMADLRSWSMAGGSSFPTVEPRPFGAVAALGQDNEAWLTSC